VRNDLRPSLRHIRILSRLRPFRQTAIQAPWCISRLMHQAKPLICTATFFL
jgi:hypothetical protein